MAKKTEENEEVLVDVQEVYSKTETFIDDNKNILTSVIVGLIVAIPLYTSIKVILKEFLSNNEIVKKLTKNL